MPRRRLGFFLGRAVDMDLKFSMVIHTEFGGFGLNEEMVRRLTERGCKWISECTKTPGSLPKWYLPYRDGRDELRKDEDLVAVVAELTQEYDVKCKELKSWQERAELRTTMQANLKVVEVTVDIEIEDHDGKESVRVSGGCW